MLKERCWVLRGEGKVDYDFFVAGLSHAPCYVLKAKKAVLFESGYHCTTAREG